MHNRSSQDAALHVLPTLWFRNVWSWKGARNPRLARVEAAHPVVRAEHHKAGVFYLHAEPEAALLFCENENDMARVFGGEPTTRFPNYAGTGWKTSGDALLANTAADQARKRREAGREQLADEYSSAIPNGQAA